MVKINQFSSSNKRKLPPNGVATTTKIVKMKKSASRGKKGALNGLSKRELKSHLNTFKFGENLMNKGRKKGTKENQKPITEAATVPKKKKKTIKDKKGKKPVPEIVVANKEEEEETQPTIRLSDAPIPKKVKWVNRQRVLVFGCRGISSRDRHLMKDLRKLMPHSRSENKMERRENLQVVNDICHMRHCDKCVLFEGRGGRDVYMWLSIIPGGPSVKFLLQNIYTMEELRFTGNCLVGSRPFLSFDSNFEDVLHYRILRELLVQIFGTPDHHPKSQPFFDHVFSFSVVDKRIWFRNYQILSEDGALSEIGPRFIMNPVKIFESSFGGKTLWENPHYVTPAKLRQLVRKAASGKYVARQSQNIDKEKNRVEKSYETLETDEVFTGNPWEKAHELVSKIAPEGENLEPSGKKKKKKLNKLKTNTAPSSQDGKIESGNKEKSFKLNIKKKNERTQKKVYVKPFKLDAPKKKKQPVLSKLGKSNPNIDSSDKLRLGKKIKRSKLKMMKNKQKN